MVAAAVAAYPGAWEVQLFVGLMSCWLARLLAMQCLCKRRLRGTFCDGRATWKDLPIAPQQCGYTLFTQLHNRGTYFLLLHSACVLTSLHDIISCTQLAYLPRCMTSSAAKK